MKCTDVLYQYFLLTSKSLFWSHWYVFNIHIKSRSGSGQLMPAWLWVPLRKQCQAVEGQEWDQAMSSSSEKEEDMEKTPDSDSLLACETRQPNKAGELSEGMKTLRRNTEPKERNKDKCKTHRCLFCFARVRGYYPDTPAFPEVASGRVGGATG